MAKKKQKVNADFQRNLRDLIEAKSQEPGMNQSKIAKSIGVSRSVISKWAMNTTYNGIPSADYLTRLAQYFGVTVDWLIGTPGAERTPDETLAATGLSAAALKNLIEINKMCQAASHVSEDILSKILASENFAALIRAMVELTILADDLEEEVTIARAMQSRTEEPAIDLDYLESSVNALRFGRYAVVEPCNALLDELRPATIEDVIKDVNNYRNGK